ncbi:unnamed protein product [Lactuca saligna]|uniref:Uncharacterized protein n=1 Tax=Lactuca saligna TaxID=75948 RepID=A0AA35YJZ5_LACSI|nr:unnamed protein product [Lactuca saligna]
MEEKRRLPSWMIGASTTNKVSKTLDKDVNDKAELNLGTKSAIPRGKGVSLKHKKEFCPSSDDKSFLVKCETKRKKRGTDEKDVNESHDFKQEVVLEKKKLRKVRRKVEEPNHSRTKEEHTAQSSDEDDEDLTIDDLLSIAKQFVENEKSDMNHQKSSEGLLKRKSSHSSSSSSVIKTSLNAPQATKSPAQEETALHYESTETTTGDAAQDMLDLLLGPLLKKSIRKEEDTSIKDMIVTHEVENLQQHDAVVSNKPLNLTKKKSSLRDAVAMLLD